MDDDEYPEAGPVTVTPKEGVPYVEPPLPAKPQWSSGGTFEHQGQTVDFALRRRKP